MIIVKNLDQLEKALLDKNTQVLEIGYTRVSTELSHQDSSIERQIEDFRDCGCDIAFIERESGKRANNRPLYQALITLIKSKRVSKVSVCESSRLNRNELNTTYFERLCEINETKLIYLDEPELNAESYRSKQLRKEKAILAESYSRQLGLNVRKGYERLRKNRKPCSKTPIYGYRFNKDREYEIDWVKEDDSNVIGVDPKTKKKYATGELARFVIEVLLEKKSAFKAFNDFKELLNSLDIVNEELYKKSNKLTNAWIYNWIKEPSLRGNLAYNKHKEHYEGEKLEIIVKKLKPIEEWDIEFNTHEAIISPNEHITINKILETNKNRGWAIKNAARKKDESIPLSIIIRCKKCNLKYYCCSSFSNGVRYRYYRCRGNKNHTCSQKGIGEKVFISQAINKIIEKAEELADILYKVNKDYQDPRYVEIEQLGIKAKKILDLYNDIKDESLLISHKNILNKIESIKQEITLDSEYTQGREQVIKALQDIEFWQSMSKIELHDYLVDIVDTAWLLDKTVDSVDLSL